MESCGCMKQVVFHTVLQKSFAEEFCRGFAERFLRGKNITGTLKLPLYFTDATLLHVFDDSVAKL